MYALLFFTISPEGRIPRNTAPPGIIYANPNPTQKTTETDERGELQFTLS